MRLRTTTTTTIATYFILALAGAAPLAMPEQLPIDGDGSAARQAGNPDSECRDASSAKAPMASGEISGERERERCGSDALTQAPADGCLMERMNDDR